MILLLNNKHDFMFLADAWLNQDSTEAVFMESVPPNFRFMNEARLHLEGGGVAILFNDSL